MPSPVGHMLFGFSIYLALNKRLDIKSNWKEIFLYIFIAAFLDLDELPHLFGFSIPFIHHRTIFHSIFFAFLSAIIFAYFFKISKTKKFPLKFLIFFSLIFSHAALDFFMEDNVAPFGLMLLWPFSYNYYLSPITLFPGVNHDNIVDLFSFHNIMTVFTEITIFAVLISMIFIYRKYILKTTS